MLLSFLKSEIVRDRFQSLGIWKLLLMWMNKEARIVAHQLRFLFNYIAGIKSLMRHLMFFNCLINWQFLTGRLSSTHLVDHIKNQLHRKPKTTLLVIETLGFNSVLKVWLYHIISPSYTYVDYESSWLRFPYIFLLV